MKYPIDIEAATATEAAAQGIDLDSNTMKLLKCSIALANEAYRQGYEAGKAAQAT